MALGFYGTGQVFIQRSVCMGEKTKAQSTLLWSMLPVGFCLFLGAWIGIVLYAVFYLCDPVLDPQIGLKKHDQLVPYFIITRFHSVPGLTGICIAGIFGGALSTISSAQNALAMITVLDFIQPLFSEKLTEKISLLIGKALGGVALRQPHQVSRMASDKVGVIVASIVIGSLITGWIGFNMLFSGYRSTPLPLEVSGCLHSNSSILMVGSLNSSCAEVENCLLENVEKPYERGRQKTMDEYFFAGRSATKIPVIMSITATTVSSILILGTSSEAYKFGPSMGTIFVPWILGMITACYVFVPVYFQCKISSVYEIMYSSCILYGPALVLNSVSNISVELAIILCGGVCTFYCFLGGLKAVLWTDVFQQILAFFCIFAVIFTGIHEIGLGEFYTRTLAGGRLNFFSFSFDLTQRYTTWNVFISGFSIALGFYGTGQVFIQRSLCMGEKKKAQSTLLWSMLPVGFCLFIGAWIGVALYAVFYLCDPVLDPQIGLKKHDQLVPYFIITRFHSVPGLTGICIAGIFSGALSTISSAQNALAMITFYDFIQPFFSEKLTEKSSLLIGKALAIVYGVIFISFSLSISKMDSMLAAGMLSNAIFEGPILAIFLIGVLTRKASDKVIVASIVIGSLITGWIGFNILFSGYRSTPLPLEVSGCLHSNSSILMVGSLNSSCAEVGSCLLEKVEKPYESFIGILTTTCIALSLILITGWNKTVIPHDSKCLSPVTRFWMNKKECVNKESEKDTINESEDEDIL
ncbi:sodium-coupled monocarboxylate transporter 1-like [Argiope bruennichi]|uniref:sodium-coupled monocarboxylate transporter 1-like n=1 Tax=Argiope bruennichi TaxID=94029 RepID=UPI00249553A8|nr:sodium-coupled monocarboxylate transporter 1-like [Argiope bruennichi]